MCCRQSLSVVLINITYDCMLLVFFGEEVKALCCLCIFDSCFAAALAQVVVAFPCEYRAAMVLSGCFLWRVGCA